MSITEFKDRINSLLSKGIHEFSMSLGVLAQIENNNYELFAVQSNLGAYVPGEKYALGETYSREVFEKQKTIAEACIANSPDAVAPSPVSFIAARVLYRRTYSDKLQTLGLRRFQQHGPARRTV